MLFDRSEIDEVKQRGGGGVDAVVQLAALLVYESRGLDEFRSAVEILLEKHRRLDAAWIALENRRPVLEKRHYAIGNVQVEAEQIKLRKFFVGPIDTVQARNRYLFATNFQD